MGTKVNQNINKLGALVRSGDQTKFNKHPCIKQQRVHTMNDDVGIKGQKNNVK